MKRALLAVAVVMPVLAVGAQDGEHLAFEVASVRPNPTGQGGMTLNSPPGRFIATNATLRRLVINAYGLASYQVEGGPAWVNEIGFDISASAGGGPPDRQMPMLRTLLAERFGLVTHVETRDENVFALEVGDADRAKASLVPTSDDCGAIREARLQAAAPSRPIPRSERPVCAQRLLAQPRPSGITLVFTAGGITMADFATWTAQYAGRHVVDRTSLAGEFDLDLQFALGLALSTSPPTLDEGPTIFVALEEQLGLTLRSSRGPVSHLVIDSAEQPDPN
jgi:uncharacterized protein (TIGR03435 family)